MPKINKTRSSTSALGSLLRGVREAMPVGIPPVLRRFWNFTRDNSREFAKHLNDPEEQEKKLINAVVRKFKG